MKSIFLLLNFILACHFTFAQKQVNGDSSFILDLNQSIDKAVINQNISLLDKWYSPDFVFSHGSGKVEGKSGWLNSVAKGNFLVRQHDSVLVEVHHDLAIVKGKLSVLKKNENVVTRYHLYYMRVYVQRGKNWHVVSHRTISEIHEPDL